MQIRKDDAVKLLSGKDRGKTGKVIRALPKAQRVVVEGLNLVKRHTKPTPRQPHGDIISFAAPIHVSNVMLMCLNCGKPTRINHKSTAKGSLRICKKCQNAVSIPKEAK
ncbi:50S ribosomal protein L24 [Candidatus Berkelbacteria bacterium]|nr:50S ribosomal protein L24 [Candidatus Berkelbacteria bacterium]